MSVKPLLDYIARYESNGDYDIVYGGIKSKDHPPKNLTKMTIGQVLDWQDSIDPHYPSEAAGRYQIMEDTLRGLYPQARLSKSDLFNQTNQDALAIQLMRRRGLDDYLNGKISAEKFCNSLAKEWASLPIVTEVHKAGRILPKGVSYYAGDGLNKAHANVDDFLSVVRSLQETTLRVDQERKYTVKEIIEWLEKIHG